MMAAAERRKQDSLAMQQNQQMARRNPAEHIPSSHPPLHHHHAMQNPLHASLPPHPNLAPHPQQNLRPGLERPMSFPTPPSSASSVMGGVNPDGSSFWGGNMAPNSLAIDTVMNSRSMPTTPATTPPGGALQQLQQQYPPPNPSIYNSNQPGMSQGSIAQQNMQRFGQPLPQPTQYMSQSRDTSNMGPPPTSRGPPTTLSRPSSRQNNAEEVHPKEEGAEEQNGLVEGAEHEDHDQDQGEEEAEHEADHEEEYTHDTNYSNSHRSGNYYPPLTADHTPHLSPEMTGSPSHGQAPSTPARSYGGGNVNVPRTLDGGSGATPRTTTTPQQQWVQSGYSTPPRTNAPNGGPIRQQPPQRNLYQLVSGDAAAEHNGANGNGAPDNGYATQQGLGVSMPAQTPQQTYAGMNGSSTPSSNKRMRMDDDDEHGSRPSSRGHDDRSGGDSEGGLKRRKTIREGSTPVGVGNSTFDRTDGRLSRTRSAVGPARARR